MAKKVTIRIPMSEGVNTFHLRRKRGRFGPVEMDQWWMPIPSVYPTNGRPGENYRAIVDLWWSDCRRIGSDSDQSIRETWLLSRLLPLTRSKGSSRIVADAAMHGPGREGVTELESLLHGDAGAVCDELTFRNQIFGLIGPETDTDQERQRYKDAVEELLGPASRSLLTESPALAEAHLVERWQEWTRRYGRRAGQEEWKTLMDIFSYARLPEVQTRPK